LFGVIVRKKVSLSIGFFAVQLLTVSFLVCFVAANPIGADYPYDPQDKITINLDQNRIYLHNLDVTFTVDLSQWLPYYLNEFHTQYQFSSRIKCYLDNQVIYDDSKTLSASDNGILDLIVPVEVSSGTHTITVDVVSSGTYWHIINGGMHSWNDPVHATASSNVTVVFDPPIIWIPSPLNGGVFTDRNVWLNTTVSKPIGRLCYSLDGAYNVTIKGNIISPDLELGAHNIMFYAWDKYGNVGASEMNNFTRVSNETPKPTVIVENSPAVNYFEIAGILSSIVIIACLGLLVFKRRKILLRQI
jgi:hypothetical protein